MPRLFYSPSIDRYRWTLPRAEDGVHAPYFRKCEERIMAKLTTRPECVLELPAELEFTRDEIDALENRFAVDALAIIRQRPPDRIPIEDTNINTVRVSSRVRRPARGSSSKKGKKTASAAKKASASKKNAAGKKGSARKR
jgi:hypothetical protein